MLYYVIQTIIFQFVFFVAYDLFLKKETFFNWNRAYLIITSVLSLIIPFIKVDAFKTIISEEFVVSLPAVILGRQVVNQNNQNGLNAVMTETNSLVFWDIIWYLGIFVSALIFLYKILNVVKIINNNPKRWKRSFWIVELINSTAAFSFFNYIFLGKDIESTDKETILHHEIVHVNQKHSFDLLFFEVQRVLFWFNPLVYIYQSRISTLHEYIADAYAVKHQNKNDYYESLLTQIFETKNLSFINTFFKQSIIKKRIDMLSKSRSKQKNLMKYTLLIPLVFGMLLYSSCTAQVNEEVGNEKSQLAKERKSLEEEIDHLQQLIKEKKAVTKEEKIKLLELAALANRYRLELDESYRENDDFKNASEVPFVAIDQVPTFSECTDLPNEHWKKCTVEKISKFINENFNVKLGKELKLSGKQRIIVAFKIDKGGNVTDVKARAAHPDLADEATRVVKLIPKMLPGEHNGKKVIVPYSLPITFVINE